MVDRVSVRRKVETGRASKGSSQQSQKSVRGVLEARGRRGAREACVGARRARRTGRGTWRRTRRRARAACHACRAHGLCEFAHALLTRRSRSLARSTLPAASNAPGFLLSVCFLAFQLHLARVLQEISTSPSFFRDHGCPRDGRHLLAPPGPPQAHGEARGQRAGLCRAHGRPTQVHLAWDVQGRVRSRLIPLQTSASTSLSAMSVAHSSRASLDLLVHLSRLRLVL